MSRFVAVNLQQLRTFTDPLLSGQEYVTIRTVMWSTLESVWRSSGLLWVQVLRDDFESRSSGSLQDQVLGVAPRSPQVQVLGDHSGSPSTRESFWLQVLGSLRHKFRVSSEYQKRGPKYSRFKNSLNGAVVWTYIAYTLLYSYIYSVINHYKLTCLNVLILVGW